MIVSIHIYFHVNLLEVNPVVSSPSLPWTVLGTNVVLHKYCMWKWHILIPFFFQGVKDLAYSLNLLNEKRREGQDLR
jgi:hypothetical protein